MVPSRLQKVSFEVLFLGILFSVILLLFAVEGFASDDKPFVPLNPLPIPKVERLPLTSSSELEVVPLPYTLMYLLEFEKRKNEGISAHTQLEILKLSEGIEGLARHLDWKNALIRVLLSTQGDADPQLLSGDEELVLRFGSVASLAAKLDFLADLMQYLVNNLLSSEIPLPQSEEGVTLVFNLKGALSALGIDAEAELQGSPRLPFGASALEPRALFDVERITVKIRSGAISSEAQLDPADLTITRGQLEVRFQIGPNTITSTTVFTKGEGLQQEVLVITAQLGSLSLTGQATFSAGLSEFKLEASLAGLLRFSTLLTPEGFREPTLGLELRF
jgi:hypothetical protein